MFKTVEITTDASSSKPRMPELRRYLTPHRLLTFPTRERLDQRGSDRAWHGDEHAKNRHGGGRELFTYGLPATSNLFTLDGMDENDPLFNVNIAGATGLTLGLNEVQEATVVNNGYSGQYGRFAGANVNYLTRSGANDFHGNALYWWSGRALDANDWFNKCSPGHA